MWSRGAAQRFGTTLSLMLKQMLYSGRCLQAMNTPWYDRQDGGDGSDGGMRADTCKLVVTAKELFQSLTAKAKQAGISIEGVDILVLTIVCCTARTYMCMHHA